MDVQPDEEPTPPPPPRWPLRAAFALAVLSALVLAAGSTLWWRAAHDESLDAARARDAALIDARRDVEVLTTLDHREVDAGLADWLAVSTGDLQDQLGTVDDDARQALADAGKVTTGTVVEIALTEIDARAGTAAGIATVEISVEDQAGEATVKRDRFTVELEREGGRWLVSALDQVAVGLQ